MPAKGALAIFVIYVVWLFIRDAKRRTQHSRALWIPLIWIGLVGSRPLSLWFGYGRDLDSGNDYAEGNPLDRLIFLALILAGAFVVAQRRNNFQSFTANNRALFWFFAFWGLSVVWADNSFVALKRWIKDLGNVVMVLVILSEKDPVGAIKTIFARCAYLFIPFSVLLIKWYPALGSYYNRWTGDAGHQGVSTNKNLLGVTLTVTTIFLVWEFLQTWRLKPRSPNRIDLANSALLMLMAVWLFKKADSATSLACTFLGGCALIALDWPMVKKIRGQLIGYAGTAAVVLVIIGSVFDLGAMGARMLGRDPSLHGRTDIWSLALKESASPLVGAGFYSFWTDERVDKFSQYYSFEITQAHNGYLETYLNGGIIGLGLLLAILLAAGMRVQKRLLSDWEWGKVSFVFWIIVLAHNWSEATYNKLSMLWVVLLLVSIGYPRRRMEPVVDQSTPHRSERPVRGIEAMRLSHLKKGPKAANC